MDSNDFKKNFTVVGGKVVQNGLKKKKYRNTYKEVDGIKFQSLKEANFYTELKLKKQAGLIKDFQRQVRFDIHVNNIFIQYYLLDFLIIHNDSSKEHIDIKGLDKESNKHITTQLFELKKKLVEAIYSITIKII